MHFCLHCECHTIAKGSPQAPAVQGILALSSTSVAITWTVPYQSDFNETYVVYYTDDYSLFSSMPNCYGEFFEGLNASIPVSASVSLDYDIAYSRNLTGLDKRVKYYFIVAAYNPFGWNASTLQSFQIVG